MGRKSKNKGANSLELRYIKVFPVLLILCGLFIVFTNLVTGVTFSLVTAFLFLPIGIFMITRSAVTFTPQTLVLKNIFGMTSKTIPIKRSDIEVRDNQVFIAGERALSLWMYDKNGADVENFAKDA